jgi:hypothetical protein
MSSKKSKGPMLGIYFGKNDQDLLAWKDSCQGSYDMTPSSFAKDAIRDAIRKKSAQKEDENDKISLKQTIHLLKKHTHVLEEILSYVKGGVVPISVSPSESQELVAKAQTPQADYVSLCKELGWG